MNSPHSKTESNLGGGSSDPLIGTVFDERYSIVSCLGSGATATAYRAIDTMLQREVAVKIIHKSLVHSQKAVDRFKLESSTTIRLSHPGIVRVYKQGCSADDRLYIVMDCLQGVSLAALIAEEGKLDFDLFFDIFLQLIEALGYAHENGVLHRDIKSSNVIIIDESERRRAVLVDFGLAKSLEHDAELAATKTGAILGSSAYMSPEQCRGQKLDERADIYSLACLMLEALTGKPPFQGESDFDVMYKHLNESLGQLGFLKELPASLSGLLTKCLQKDPTLRYRNMQELRTDFANCSDMADTLKRRWQAKRAIRDPRVFNRIVLLLSVLVLGLSLAYAFNWSRRNKIEANALLPNRAGRSLEPPEKVRLPLHAVQFKPILDKYSEKLGPKSVLVLLHDWEKRHLRDAEEFDKMAVTARLCSTYVEMGQTSKAEELANKVFSRRSLNGGFYCNTFNQMLEYYIKNGEKKKIAALLERILREKSLLSGYEDQQDMLLFKLARGYSELGDYKKVVEILEPFDKDPTLKSRTRSFELSWRDPLITALAVLGRSEEAQRIAKEYNTDPSCPRIRSFDFLVLGDSFARANAVDDALKYYLMGVDKAIAEGFQSRDQMHVCIQKSGRIYRERGNFKELLDLEKRGLKETKEWRQRAAILMAMSDASLFSGEDAVAFDYSKQALSLCQTEIHADNSSFCKPPDFVYLQAVMQMRNFLNARKRSDEALALINDWIEKIHARAGNNLCLSSLYFLKGQQLLAEENKPVDALESIEKARSICFEPEVQDILKKERLSIDERLSDIYETKGAALQRCSRIPESVAAFKQALAYVENKPGMQERELDRLLGLATMLYLSKQFAEMDLYSKRAADLWLRLYYQRAWTLVEANKLRAIADLRRSSQHFIEAENLYRIALAGIQQRGIKKRNSLLFLFWSCRFSNATKKICSSYRTPRSINLA